MIYSKSVIKRILISSGIGLKHLIIEKDGVEVLALKPGGTFYCDIDEKETIKTRDLIIGKFPKWEYSEGNQNQWHFTVK